MKALRTGLGTLALAILTLAGPGNAGAVAVIPPGNSAATQYTEALPTAGGPKGTGHAGERGRERSPNEVLGKRTTRHLEAQGAEGRAVAEVVAETAPSPPIRASVDSGGKLKRSNGQEGRQTNSDSGGSVTRAAGDDGSSGLGEVAGQATGSSSSSEMGPLLPLLIAAVLLWAAVYWSRQRRRPAA